MKVERTRRDAGHDVVQVLATAIAEQHQIDALQLAQVGQRGGDQLQIKFGIKEGPESYKAKWITLHYGDTYQRLSGDGSFHWRFPVRIASCSSLPELARNWNDW